LKKPYEAVVVGAGIAGAAAAWHLTVRHGLKRIAIVESGDPLSLTSDKSTECYRNWFPGPGTALVDFTNRSIDILEELSALTGERFNMNRRGYLFATADPAEAKRLKISAMDGAARGVGPFREHTGTADDPDYVAHRASGWHGMPTGTDLLLGADVVHKHFPALSRDTIAALHVRRCGWLRAQQLGQFFLEEARQSGAELVRARVTAINRTGGAISGVEIESESGRETLRTGRVVLSPGPGLAQALQMLDVSLPVSAELHVKVALRESHQAFPEDAPLMLWMDPVRLPWSEDEKAVLASDPSTAHLLEEFPAGVHGRPEGAGSAQHALMLWTFDIHTTQPTFPIEWDPHLPEIIVRGMTAMLPRMNDYLDRLPRMVVDGGYYIKTPENRPLVGPLPIEGAFVNAAYSGFGIMSACAGGELIANHVMGAPLPDYAAALLPSRFDDPGYLANFGDAAAGQM
jgi:glycine/D-amino acid oxidase-like deaminating enzyme